MVPDTCLRLRTVLKALDDIITPALPGEAGFAHEQLALIKKSVQLVIDQIPQEYAFMVRDAQDHLALAGGISLHLTPGSAWHTRITGSSAQVQNHLPATVPDVGALEQELRTLKQDLEDAVNELCHSLQGAELAAIEQLVLDHSANRIVMERAWTIGTGFETDPAAIPPIAELLGKAYPNPLR